MAARRLCRRGVIVVPGDDNKQVTIVDGDDDESRLL